MAWMKDDPRVHLLKDVAALEALITGSGENDVRLTEAQRHEAVREIDPRL